MYNRNVVRLYLGISRNSYLLMLSGKPYRMYIANWHPDGIRYISKRGERMNVFNYYLHNFALSLYVCPDNKVKSNLVMVFGVDLILFPHFYYHAFVSEKSSDLDRFVVTEIYVLQSIPYFQSFQIVIVVADVAVCKGGIQRCLMYILRDFLVRFKRLFGWSSDLFLFGR